MLSQRKHVGRIARLGGPGGDLVHIVEKSLSTRAVDAENGRFAHGVRSALGLHDVADGLACQRVVLCGIGGNDAVAIEAHGAQLFTVCGHIGQRNHRGVGAPCLFQNAVRYAHERSTRSCTVIDGSNLQSVAGLRQLVRVMQLGAGPCAGCQQLRRPDAAVVVGVDEVERAFIKLDTARGAGKRYPKLLVQFGQVSDILAVADDDLVHASGAKELPCVRRGGWGMH